MRVVAGISLIFHAVVALQPTPASRSILWAGFDIITGIFLCAGLWTPVVGSLVAGLGLWQSIFGPGDPWACIFLATIGAGLALVGPGAWSVDSRLFGWKRINVRDRES
jgi:hypothetical protein